MRFYCVFDRVAGTIKKFYSFQDAEDEAINTMKVYIKLNNKVTCKEVNKNFYIILKEE